jgi:beta-mannosidase
MGFQSYPSIKTINSFTAEEDRSPYAPVMYSHQKCKNGNEAIEEYMKRDYLVPTLFTDYVYLSQLQAGEIMKYSVEHFRGDSSYCRGLILWQLNDCWPVVSWSGIDYYGRWKALQYFIRRFYAPVLLIVEYPAELPAEGAESRITLKLCNDRPDAVKAAVTWRLRETSGAVLRDGEIAVTVPAGETSVCGNLDFSGVINDTNRKRVYLEYALGIGDVHRGAIPGETGGLSSDSNGSSSGGGTVLFVSPKEFEFTLPSIEYSFAETAAAYKITVTADCFVKALELDTKNGDCIFSDNWFDMIPGTAKTVTVLKQDAVGIASLAELRANLTGVCLNQVFHRARGLISL